MACLDCESNIWKQKLGRCKRCVYLNLFLLIVSALISYILWQQQPKSVQSIAALFTFFACAILMFLHGVAFIYYQLVKEDKHTLK